MNKKAIVIVVIYLLFFACAASETCPLYICSDTPLLLKHRGCWGYINASGAIAIGPGFDAASDFSENIAFVAQDDSKLFNERDLRYSLIDSTGHNLSTRRFIQPAVFHKGRAAVTDDKNNSCVIDTSGKNIIGAISPSDSSSRHVATPSHQPLAEASGNSDVESKERTRNDFDDDPIAFQDDYKSPWGYRNRAGVTIIAPQFDEAFDFSEGLAFARIGNKVGFINKSGNWSFELPHNCSGIGQFSEGMVPVAIGRTEHTENHRYRNRNSKIAFYDKTGKQVIPPTFESCEGVGFNKGLACVSVSTGDAGVRFGYVDPLGKFVIPAKYLFANPFSDGLAAVCFDKNDPLVAKQLAKFEDPEDYFWRKVHESIELRLRPLTNRPLRLSLSVRPSGQVGIVVLRKGTGDADVDAKITNALTHMPSLLLPFKPPFETVISVYFDKKLVNEGDYADPEHSRVQRLTALERCLCSGATTDKSLEAALKEIIAIRSSIYSAVDALDFYDHLLYLYTSSHKITDAQTVLSDMLPLLNKSTKSAITLHVAAELATQKQFSQAENVLKTELSRCQMIVQRSPASDSARRHLLEVREQLGDFYYQRNVHGLALDSYKKCVEESKVSGSEEMALTHERAIYKLAWFYVASGDYKPAAPLFEEVLQYLENDTRCRYFSFDWFQSYAQALELANEQAKAENVRTRAKGIWCKCRDADWGYIDKSGATVIRAGFYEASPFEHGFASVNLFDMEGLINAHGQWIFRPLFYEKFHFNNGIAEIKKAQDDFPNIGADSYVQGKAFTNSQFVPDKAVQPQGRKYASTTTDQPELFETLVEGERLWGYKSSDKSILFAPAFKRASKFVGGFATAVLGRSLFLLDEHGRKTQLSYERASEFQNGSAIVFDDSKQGLIDESGKILIEPKYDEVSRFHQGLALVRKEGKYGFVDHSGNEAIPLIYDDGGDFSENLAPVKVGNFYGYIDSSGHMKIKPQFKGAKTFSEGLAAVKFSGPTGIDKNLSKGSDDI